MNRRELFDRLFKGCTFMALSLSIGVLVAIVFFIALKGISSVNLNFLLSKTQDFGAQGGIFYQICGSLLIVFFAGLFCFPIAIGAALCNSEWIRNKKAKRFASTLIYALNGVPSIVFGIFGLIFFVNYCGMGISWLAGSLVLSFMILPTIMVSSYNAMNNIPQMYRDSALALGLNSWQVITAVILPQSYLGMLSGLFIGLARAIGETAPIMFVATAFSGVMIPTSFWEPVSTLPTHILALSQEAINPLALENAWGTAWVLICIVFSFSLISLWVRIKINTGIIK